MERFNDLQRVPTSCDHLCPNERRPSSRIYRSWISTQIPRDGLRDAAEPPLAVFTKCCSGAAAPSDRAPRSTEKKRAQQQHVKQKKDAYLLYCPLIPRCSPASVGRVAPRPLLTQSFRGGVVGRAILALRCCRPLPPPPPPSLSSLRLSPPFSSSQNSAASPPTPPRLPPLPPDRALCCCALPLPDGFIRRRLDAATPAPPGGGSGYAASSASSSCGGGEAVGSQTALAQCAEAKAVPSPLLYSRPGVTRDSRHAASLAQQWVTRGMGRPQSTRQLPMGARPGLQGDVRVPRQSDGGSVQVRVPNSPLLHGIHLRTARTRMRTVR